MAYQNNFCLIYKLSYQMKNRSLQEKKLNEIKYSSKPLFLYIFFYFQETCCFDK